MSIYIINGFDSSCQLSLEENDELSIEKIYLLSIPGVEVESEDNKIEIINDMNILDFYNKNDLENLDRNIIFIDLQESNKKDNYLEVMYKFNTARFERRAYYSSLDKVIKIKDFPLIEHFNPWVGETLSNLLTQNEKEYIQNMYSTMKQIIIQYLKAEFHLKKISSIPDGWTMNLSSPELEGLITYYGLFPNASDMKSRPQIEYAHNSQYRQIVTKTLIHVVASYLLKNGIVDSVQVIDWYNYKTWLNI
jgi:hypothetical protein